MPQPVSTRLANLWARLSPLPGGRRLFGQVFGRFVPYSATIGARVLELAPGRAVVSLPDRRRIRNHLDSVHAVALINLGELASGLATTMAFPPEVRGIVTKIEAEYFKKARGELRAVADVALPAVGEEPVFHRVEALITDSTGELVCRVLATWNLRRLESPEGAPRQ